MTQDDSGVEHPAKYFKSSFLIRIYDSHLSLGFIHYLKSFSFFPFLLNITNFQMLNLFSSLPKKVFKTKPDIKTYREGSKTLDVAGFYEDSTLLSSCKHQIHNSSLMLSQIKVKLFH